MSNSRQQLQGMAADAARRYGLPPDVFQAMIQQESNWNPTARSPKGAAGLGQFMPATWKAYGGGASVFDPAANLDASAHYLSDLYKQYGSLEPALAAYNGGPKAGAAYQAGRYTNRETAAYVPTVMSGRSAFSGGAVVHEGTPDPLAGVRTSAHVGQLQPELLSALSAAAGELKGQGFDLAPYVTSGFRSKEEQARLYANYKAGNSAYPAAPPGHSYHETGLAVDINVPRMSAGDQQTVLGVLGKYGLYRNDPVGDAVHFEFAGTKGSLISRTSPTAAAPKAAAGQADPWWMPIVMGAGYKPTAPASRPPGQADPWWMPIVMGAAYKPAVPTTPAPVPLPNLAGPMSGSPLADRILAQTAPMVDQLLSTGGLSGASPPGTSR